MTSPRATSRARTDLVLHLDPAQKNLGPPPDPSPRLKHLLKLAAVPGTAIKGFKLFILFYDINA